MLIELHGGQFANKGAAKMLLSAMDEIGSRLPHAEFVVDACVGTSEQLRQARLATLLGRRGWMGSRSFKFRLGLQKLVPGLVNHTDYLRKTRRVSLSSVDALVDLSGFAYSDQWGTRPTEDFAELATYYHSQSKPVILLPQALGPFAEGRNQLFFRRIGQASRVIYSRDRSSLDFAKEVCSERTDLRLCPDMTIPCASEFREPSPENLIYVVPNVRMIDRNQREFSREDYVRMLVRICESLRGRSDLRILLHDQGGADESIAREVEFRLNQVGIVEFDDDPWRLKRKISGARMVVASRYHALVAALSCGIPSIAIGWSHKYSELMHEFGCSDCSFEVTDPIDLIIERTLQLREPQINGRRREELKSLAMQKHNAVKEMWDSVAEILIQEA